MNYFEMYRDRIESQGVNRSDRLVKTIEKNFLKTLAKDPYSMKIPITDVDEVNITQKTKILQCIVNDYSDNDQKSFDEKWLFVKKEDNVDVGCYAKFDNAYWLVVFKEHNSINAYKKFIMKKCNQVVRYEYSGIVYDIPVVVKNLTQYSDGLQDIVYTSVPDSRRNIMYGVNGVTKNINLGQRVMVQNKNVYRVTHIDDFQFNGLGSAIVVHTALRDTDDLDNNLADNDIIKDPLDLYVIGQSNVVPSGKFKYSLSQNIYTDWKVEYKGEVKNYVSLSRSDMDCVLDIKGDMDLIGESFNLIALDNRNVEQSRISIDVTGF